MAKAKTVKDLKQLAFLLFGLADPKSIPDDHPLLAVVLKVLTGKPTLNHAFLACVIAGLVWPDRRFVIGKGWGGWKHGQPYAEPGEELTGRELLARALNSERYHGMHGRGREWGGYADAYRAGIVAVLRHGSADQRKIAAELLSIALLLDYLLTVPGSGGDVVELGGRATGKVAGDLSHMQRLWRGQHPDFGEHDWVTAPRMWKGLTAAERGMVADVPAGPKEAIAELERLAPVLPCGFSWWSYDDGSWNAQVEEARSFFVQQRTGKFALNVSADHGGVVGYLDVNRLHPNAPQIGVVHRYHVPKDRAAKPDPPRPEEPTEPPNQEPDLLGAVRAWAVSPEAPRGVKRFREELLERLAGIRGVAR